MTITDLPATEPAGLWAEPETESAARGRTAIAPRVVEKIARRAAEELDGLVAPPSKARSRIFVGQDAPSVSAHIDGATTWVELRAGLRYPLPLVSTGRSVQQRVRERISMLTGLIVSGVEVELAPVFDRADPHGSVH